MQGIAEVCKVLLCCLGWVGVCGLTQDSMANPKKDEIHIRSFEDLYEPSAAVALEGGGVLLLEDDGAEMASLHEIVQDDFGLLLKKQYTGDVHLDVTDVEGAAKGGQDRVFVMTSHSVNKRGLRRAKREQLLQLKVSEKMDMEFLGGTGLWDEVIGELLKIDPAMSDRKKELNVEGIAFAKSEDALMLGLRNPTYKGRAIVLLLENPYEIVSENYTPKFSVEPLLLDLGGAGVRTMSFHEGSGQYFFVSEVKTKKKKMRSRLWAWDGNVDHDPVRMTVPGLKRLKNIEGLTFFNFRKKDMVLLVCDDGNKKKKKGAHYAIIETGQVTKKSVQ